MMHVNARFRVCHVINSLGFGGAENLLIDLVDTMSSVDSTVIALEAGGDLRPDLEDVGVNVYYLSERFRFDPRTVMKLRRVLAHSSFDIVHTHLPYAQTIARIATRLAGQTPVVSTQHNVAGDYHPVIRTTEKLTRRFDHKTVAVSQGVERSHTGQAHEPGSLSDDWCTIYNGIDVEEFRNSVMTSDMDCVRERYDIEPDSAVFLNVGRYTSVKGQQDLLEAFDRAETNTAQLLLVGHGPLEDDLAAEAQERGLDDRVHVTGRVPEVFPYYGIADTFVTASHREGLPITLLEAMVADLPVLAPNIPGVNEVVKTGETGQLCPAGDLVALAAAIDQFAARDLTAHVDAIREHVESRFHIKTIAESYRDLYAAVCS